MSNDIVVGRRALATREAVAKASANVINTLTEERMLQCFPEYATDYPNLILGLQQIVQHAFNHQVPQAWNVVEQTYDFVAKANQLDRLLEEAEARRARGDPPSNMYLHGASASITVPSATVPLLQQATLDLKAKTLALEEENQATHNLIIERQSKSEKMDARIRQLVQDFTNSMETLEGIDYEEIEELQKRMLSVLPK